MSTVNRFLTNINKKISSLKFLTDINRKISSLKFLTDINRKISSLKRERTKILSRKMEEIVLITSSILFIFLFILPLHIILFSRKKGLSPLIPFFQITKQFL